MKKSWVDYSKDCDFTIYNFPFGVGKLSNGSTRCLSAIGDYAIDLNVLHEENFLSGILLPERIFRQSTLNQFIALGKEITSSVRKRLIDLFSEGNDELRTSYFRDKVLIPLQDVEMLLPVEVKNYTDFYSSKEHATNLGKMFRDPENALLPNWLWIPVGYHGRASSIVPSGVPIIRPKGQIKPPTAQVPVYAPTQKLDIELEVAFVVGKETPLGYTISTSEAEDYIFGLVLFNDWSARDIQVWEYVPLGPFLGKNFGSSVSPWIVTLEALEPFRVSGPKQEPEPLNYLQFSGNRNFDIQLEVYIQPQNGEEEKIITSNFKYLYWNMVQQLAHHTCNGCNIQVGDMYASGTISGPEPESYGSLIERTWNGKHPLKLKDGSERTFLQDFDTIIMKGFAQNGDIRVGFGEVRTKILPGE